MPSLACYFSRVSEPQPQANVTIRIEDAGGVWANYAQVSHSPYEFTLDFVRMDYNQTPPQGLVVARVNMSPLLVSQLIEALGTNWTAYAQKALPGEVYGNDDNSSGL